MQIEFTGRLKSQFTRHGDYTCLLIQQDDSTSEYPVYFHYHTLKSQLGAERLHLDGRLAIPDESLLHIVAAIRSDVHSIYLYGQTIKL